MKTSLRFLACCALFGRLTMAATVNWAPVDPAELTSKTPQVDKDADAEAIFWDVRVADEAQGSIKSVLNHYIRVKIFTDRGREAQSTINITFFDKTNISDIVGRTIKPDGSIIEIKKDAIYERTIAKAGGFRVRTKSFAMPGVEPGAIIEYQWKESRDGQLANYMRLYFQRDIPIRLVRYYIKPLALPGFDFVMKAGAFQAKNTPFVREPDGYFSTFMTNVTAFKEEPGMPPEDELRAWMLIYYSDPKKVAAENYWQTHGKEVYEAYKPITKPNDAVKRAAQAAISSATSDAEKVQRLADYCRKSIKNVNSAAADLSAEDRAGAKENKSPGDTLKRGMGTGHDIDMLFAAMARAVGLDARVAMLADRNDKFFDKSFHDPYFLRAYDVAVKLGNEWRFFDPGAGLVPHGMLRWQEEGVEALISDPKEPFFLQTPLAGPEKSRVARRARFKLSEDGTIEGDVTVTQTGHAGVTAKNTYAGDAPEKRVADLQEKVKEHFSTAELSKVILENVGEAALPFRYSYHVRVPGYAQRTGRRILLQFAYFQRNVPTRFPTSQRKHPIYFQYPWSEEDEVHIELPAGYELEQGESPGGSDIGTIGKYEATLGLSLDKKLLVYKRTFFWGRDGKILFPATSYAPIKRAFDAIHEFDNHAVTLRLAAAK